MFDESYCDFESISRLEIFNDGKISCGDINLVPTRAQLVIYGVVLYKGGFSVRVTFHVTSLHPLKRVISTLKINGIQ